MLNEEHYWTDVCADDPARRPVSKAQGIGHRYSLDQDTG